LSSVSGRRHWAAVPGDPFKLGKVNAVNALTQLTGTTNNALLRIHNDSRVQGATALDLQVAPGKPPVRVNSRVRVANLNADRLDGKDAAAFARADTPTYVSSNVASTRPPPFDPFASNRAFCDDGDHLLVGTSTFPTTGWPWSLSAISMPGTPR
jgi:hypothetical protein